jgi:CheY-like chemotaxis protein
MPDLLILSPTSEQTDFISKLGEAEGFRVKACLDVATSKKWLSTKAFDFFVVNDSFGEKTIELLTNLLWGSNTSAQATLFNLEDLSDEALTKKRWSAGLQGCVFCGGKETYRGIALELRKYAQQRSRAAGSFKVMVVEDLEAARDIICSFVEHLESAKVRGVSSGKEALDELIANPQEYACVITDINMPGMTGVELTEKIRSNDKIKHIPVLALTAYGTPDVLLKCLSAGASGFLVKPPSKSNLSRELGRVKRLLASKEDPRLIQPTDVESMREILEEKGYI